MTKLAKSYHYAVLLNTIAALIFISLAQPNLALATEVQNLYEASVAVNDQGNDTRRTAQKAAFEQVLVKVSGTYQVLDNPQVKQAVRNAASYLRRFQFNRLDDNRLTLLAHFDEAKINKLLRQEDLPIWGKRRPSILLWMAGEDAQTAVRHVISKESYSHLLEQILKTSNERGLPIIIPLYDIVDNQKVSVSDVWGYFYNHIRKFSPRYQADAIVIARFWQEKASDDESTISQPITQALPWQLQWRLFESDDLVKVNRIKGELPEVLNQLVNQVADKYAQDYAVDTSKIVAGNSLSLTVKNVAGIERLIDAEKILQSFSVVSSVMLRKINAAEAVFEVRLVGEALDLVQGLDLEPKLEKIFDPLAEEPQKAPLEYRWKP